VTKRKLLKSDSNKKPMTVESWNVKLKEPPIPNSKTVIANPKTDLSRKMFRKNTSLTFVGISTSIKK